jgi:hypothetical protein
MEKGLIIKRLKVLIDWGTNIRDDVISVNGAEDNGAKEWQLDINALTEAINVIEDADKQNENTNYFDWAISLVATYVDEKYGVEGDAEVIKKDIITATGMNEDQYNCIRVLAGFEVSTHEM